MKYLISRVLNRAPFRAILLPYGIAKEVVMRRMAAAFQLHERDIPAMEKAASTLQGLARINRRAFLLGHHENGTNGE